MRPSVLILAIVVATVVLLPGCASRGTTPDATPQSDPAPTPAANDPTPAHPGPAGAADSNPSGEDSVTMRAAVLRAEDRRTVDDTLLAALEDSRPDVRAPAVRALGRIGDPDTQPALARAASDADAAVRSEAAVAIGLFGDPSGLETLTTLAGDAQARVRLAAAIGLSRIDDPGIELPLAALLRDDTPVVAVMAFAALSRVKRPAFAVDALLERQADENSRVALGAARALAALASARRGVDFPSRMKIRRRMVELSRSEFPELRILAAQSLAVPSGASEVGALGRLVDDPHPLVRIQAVRSFSFPGAPIDPYLRKTLEDPDDRVVLATVDSLPRLADETAIDVLARLIIYDERNWLRERAVRLLPLINSTSAAAMAHSLSNDESVAVRLASAGLVLGHADPKSLEIANRLTADAESAVRRAAVPALAHAEGSLAELLAAWIDSPDADDRVAVARAAGRRWADEALDVEQRTEALGLLERMLASAVESRQFAAAREILRAAEPGGVDSRARALFERGVACEDPSVRRVAARALRDLFGEDLTAKIGPASERPLDDYIDIVRWAERPRAAVITVERPGFRPGRFTVSLDTHAAPLASYEFARLAEAGFYDGVEFSRLIPNSRIVHGDSARIDRGPRLRPEPSLSPLPPGTLVMTSADQDSSAVEWFITLAHQPVHARGSTAFGRVVQNFQGVTSLMLPGDRVVSIRIYEGDGSEKITAPGLNRGPR